MPPKRPPARLLRVRAVKPGRIIRGTGVSEGYGSGGIEIGVNRCPICQIRRCLNDHIGAGWGGQIDVKSGSRHAVCRSSNNNRHGGYDSQKGIAAGGCTACIVQFHGIIPCVGHINITDCQSAFRIPKEAGKQTAVSDDCNVWACRNLVSFVVKPCKSGGGQEVNIGNRSECNSASFLDTMSTGWTAKVGGERSCAKLLAPKQPKISRQIDIFCSLCTNFLNRTDEKQAIAMPKFSHARFVCAFEEGDATPDCCQRSDCDGYGPGAGGRANGGGIVACAVSTASLNRPWRLNSIAASIFSVRSIISGRNLTPAPKRGKKERFLIRDNKP